MKKWKAILVILIIGGLMVSCKKNSDDLNSSNVGSELVSTNNTISREEFFLWDEFDDTRIVGYSEKGLRQTELIIPEKCTSVQGLSNNDTVQHISFENNDTKIVSSTFYNCTALTDVVLPENITEISNSVFGNCTSLKQISVPDSVTQIGTSAFAYCDSLEIVELGTGIESIGRDAFYSCAGLKEISIPDGVKKIEDSVFKNCLSLENIIWGNGVVEIGESAFQNCNALKTVQLPEGVTSLEIFSFANCEQLESIYLPATIEMAEISSIVQNHQIKVYVVEESYMDQRLEEMMGVEFYDKQYH